MSQCLFLLAAAGPSSLSPCAIAVFQERCSGEVTAVFLVGPCGRCQDFRASSHAAAGPAPAGPPQA